MITFSPDKAVQAAAELLRTEPARQMSYLRLLKLLYLAERRSLKESGAPILGGKFVAMKNGPLHSEVYDLIKGDHPQQARWAEHIRKQGYHVQLEQDPGVKQLSRFEIQILREVADHWKDQDDWELAESTHSFPEWRKNYVEGTSRVIPLEDAFSAVGFAPADVQAAIADLTA
jgi:uncharacterized phage-associated protein